MMVYDRAVAEHHRETLQLPVSFGEAELRATYRRLLWTWHPDRVRGQDEETYNQATERTQSLTVAYAFLKQHGGWYEIPTTTSVYLEAGHAPHPAPCRQGRTVPGGFPDPTIPEICLQSSHILSAGYHALTQTLYLKFRGNRVYRYIGVPAEVVEAFLKAPSHGAFGHRHIYHQFRQERC